MFGISFIPKSANITIYEANKKSFVTPELEGFRRPNWAQIEPELRGSDMDGLFLLFCIITVKSVGFTSY